MNIIGLGGTNGSGKDTVGHMLAERRGFLFVSASDLLREELRRRGLSLERENLSALSAEWRREHGMAVLVDKAVEYFQAQEKSYKGLAIASLRHPGEAERIRELGGKTVWVDADPKVRYERIMSRQRGSEDNKTYEQFLAEEQAEMQPSGDDATLNMTAVRDQADSTLENNGTNISAFKEQASAELASILG